MSDSTEKHLVSCAQCNSVVEASVRGEYVRGEEPEDESRFLLLECLRCHFPFLAKSDRDTYRSGGYIDYTWAEPQIMYPSSDAELDMCIPASIRRIFDEAVGCYRHRYLNACAVMCRKALEALCEEFGSEGKNLAAKLHYLKNNSGLEARLYEWATMLRLAGNEAAHDVSMTATLEDAKDVLDFTRALLDYMYVFENRYRAYKSRKEDR